MESELAHFLRHNKPPSEENRRVIEDILAKHNKSAEDARTEIDRISKMLDNALEKFHEIEECLQNQNYETVISPARRIPIDILHQIFYHCLPAHRNPIMSASEAPMLLTRVCSTWRSIAMSSPRIWSKICINFAYSPPMEIDLGGSVIDGAKVLQMRCEAVKEWLDRSGSCPLSISIFHSGNFGWPSSISHHFQILGADPDDASTLELFKTISSLSHRWHELELVMPTDVYFQFESMVSSDKLSALTTLRTSLNPRIHWPDEYLPGPGLKLLKAPNLQNISLVGSGVKLWNPTIAPWTHVTNFSSHAAATLMDCFTLLVQCGNLINCKFKLLPFGADLETLHFYTRAELPFLQSFSVAALLTEKEATGRFLSHINAPLLSRIGYQCYDTYARLEENIIMNLAPFPWLPFLQTSRIRSLTIDPRVLSGDIEELVAIFRLSPNLTHLVVGQEANGRWSSGMDNNPMESYDYLSLLELLIVEPESSDKEIFLPNLEYFEAPVNRGVSQKTVLRFITSRMNPSCTRGTALLKSVKMTLSSPKRLNLSREIDDIGESVGVQLKTTFEYISRTREPNYNFSPSYGLARGLRKNDRSWPYLDIDESIVDSRPLRNQD